MKSHFLQIGDTIAQRSYRIQCHALHSVDSLLVVLLGEDGADEAGACGLVGK